MKICTIGKCDPKKLKKCVKSKNASYRVESNSDKALCPDCPTHSALTAKGTLPWLPKALCPDCPRHSALVPKALCPDCSDNASKNCADAKKKKPVMRDIMMPQGGGAKSTLFWTKNVIMIYKDSKRWNPLMRMLPQNTPIKDNKESVKTKHKARREAHPNLFWRAATWDALSD